MSNINLPRLQEASVKLPKVPASPKVKDNHGKLFHDAMKTAYAMQTKGDKVGAKQALLAAQMNCDAMSMATKKQYDAEYKAFMQLAKKYKIVKEDQDEKSDEEYNERDAMMARIEGGLGEMSTLTKLNTHDMKLIYKGLIAGKQISAHKAVKEAKEAKEEKKDLTAEEKKELLADFKEWSGGFSPNECTWNKILKYMNSTMDGGIDIWAATKFMKAEMDKAVKEATDLDRARVAKAALDSSRKASSFRVAVKGSTLSDHDEKAVLKQLTGYAGDNVLTKADIKKISLASEVNYHELLGLANLDD